MKQVALVLQYPAPQLGRTIALGATTNPKVLRVFCDAVIKEAKHKCDLQQDEVLVLQERLEMERLERLLSLVVPQCCLKHKLTLVREGDQR